MITGELTQQGWRVLENFAIGYYACLDAGFDVAVCSPLGGAAPIDPATGGLLRNRAAINAGQLPERICRCADAFRWAADFGAAYYCDGRGALWDLRLTPIHGA
jgi:hypothetical protein